jgi:hypothetical protein
MAPPQLHFEGSNLNLWIHRGGSSKVRRNCILQHHSNAAKSGTAIVGSALILNLRCVTLLVSSVCSDLARCPTYSATSFDCLVHRGTRITSKISWDGAFGPEYPSAVVVSHNITHLKAPLFGERAFPGLIGCHRSRCPKLLGN